MSFKLPLQLALETLMVDLRLSCEVIGDGDALEIMVSKRTTEFQAFIRIITTAGGTRYVNHEQYVGAVKRAQLMGVAPEVL